METAATTKRSVDSDAKVPPPKETKTNTPRLDYSSFFVGFYAYNEDGLCAGAYRVPWPHFTEEEHALLFEMFDNPSAHENVSYLSRENLFLWRLGKRLGWWEDEYFDCDVDAQTAKLTPDLVQFKMASGVIAGPLVG